MPSNKEDFSYPEPTKDTLSDSEELKSEFRNQPQSAGSVTTKDPAIKAYVGTKVILAKPMTSDDFKRSKGQPVGNDENAHGYQVTYEDGYISWSPKAVFERCYREITPQERSLVYTGSL